MHKLERFWISKPLLELMELPKLDRISLFFDIEDGLFQQF